MKKLQFHAGVIMAFAVVIAFSSCVSSRKLKYFTNIPESGVTDVVKIPIVNTIAPNDILHIAIISNDETTNKILNSAGTSQPSAAGAASSGGGGGSDYLVSDSGYIKLAVIGSLKVTGMKKEQLSDTIVNILTRMKYVIDPIVTIRLVNFRVTVLGEVMRPGVITVPNEHINMNELIGMAGDLTIYGNRENVLLIREKDGKRYFTRFNLSEINYLNSDIFNLQNQDVLYIEPTKAKAASIDRKQQTLSLVISSLSIFLVIYTQLIK